MKMRVAASVGLGLLMSFAAVAHAQTQTLGEMIANAVTAQTSGIGDAVVAQDQALWEQLDIAKRFNLHFKPHQDVCTDSGEEVHCTARVVTNGRGTPDATPKVISGYGPAQFIKAYGVSGQASGTPIIAIVDAYDHPYIANDLATYSATFGLPKLPTCTGAIKSSVTPCFQKVNQSGQARNYPRSSSGWALEIALDVEAAHAVCQNCSILLVEASSASFFSLTVAEDTAAALGATAISNSWGAGEFSSETQYDSHFNHPGVAITVSSGDSGYGVEYPASSRYVTAVGGTSLFLNNDNSYNSEAAWSGAGSGCSAYEQKPSWQIDTGCSRRTVVDVSADADPNTGAAVYDSVRYGGVSGWFQVGGTSLASPIVAAVYALSGNTAGTASSIPYTNTGWLHDVVSGKNGSCGTYLCAAGVGYDGPTGLGSPATAVAF